MKKINNIFLAFALGLFLMFSCEEVDDPLAGLEEVENFVQFGADTPATITASEDGDNSDFTVQAPVSAGEDLLATISVTGTAVLGVDYDVVDGSGSDNVGGVVSKSASEIVVKIPFIPTGGNDLISDQVKFSVVYLTDGVVDGDKTLTLTLTGAKGTKDSSLTFAGGRGPIRVTSTITIGDVDE